MTEINCHPFQYGRFLWMHNGRIAGFRQIRRVLCEHLRDDLYDFVQGTTDSEHAFALFLNELRKRPEDCGPDDWLDALQRTIRLLEQWQQAVEVSETSWLNFCLTDGSSMLATKYVTDRVRLAQSLYYARGRRFELRDGHYRMITENAPAQAVIIASEPLTYDHSDWEPVPVNHSISVSADCRIGLQPI